MDNPYGKITTIEKVMNLFNDGMSIMFGGFGGVGTPPTIIDGIINKNIRHLTLIGNDTGFPTIGIGKVISAGQAKRVIVSHIGSNPIAGQLMTTGELEVEFCPQGTLVEKIRAGGVGIPAILTDVGIDNEMVTRDKPTYVLNGKTHLVESALTSDISIIYAKRADPFGNLIYDKSARNTNPLVAMAGEITIVEVEEMTPLGGLDPDEIMTSGVFIDYIVPSQGVNWKWVWE